MARGRAANLPRTTTPLDYDLLDGCTTLITLLLPDEGRWYRGPDAHDSIVDGDGCLAALQDLPAAVHYRMHRCRDWLPHGQRRSLGTSAPLHLPGVAQSVWQ